MPTVVPVVIEGIKDIVYKVYLFKTRYSQHYEGIFDVY